MSVGRGSKETQFHGSEEKGAGSIKIVIQSTLAEWDDEGTRLVWRTLFRSQWSLIQS